MRYRLALGAFCALVTLSVAPAAAQSANGVGTPFELAFWQAVAGSGDPELYLAYLEQYPNGTFAAIARTKTAVRYPTVRGAPAEAAPVAPPAPMASPSPSPSLPSTAPSVPLVNLPLIPLPEPIPAAMPASARPAALEAAAAAMRVAEQARITAASAVPVSELAPIPALAAPDPVTAPTPMPAPTVMAGVEADGPVGSPALLAAFASRPAPMPNPAQLPVPVAFEPAPAPTVPAALLAAQAARGAVAAQVTPPPTPPPLPLPPPAPVRLAPVPLPVRTIPASAPARPQRAPMIAATYAPAPYRMTRAVLSTAATSPAMADMGSSVSPLGLMLAQLAHTQQTPGYEAGMAEEMALPLRPQFQPVPEVALPARFCSIDQRNAFHEGIYQPAVAIAAHNNDVAVAYIRRLQTLYDTYQLSGDSGTLAAITAEARDFRAQATQAYATQDTLVHQFEDLMAVPVASCGAIQ